MVHELQCGCGVRIINLLRYIIASMIFLGAIFIVIDSAWLHPRRGLALGDMERLRDAMDETVRLGAALGRWSDARLTAKSYVNFSRRLEASHDATKAQTELGRVIETVGWRFLSSNDDVTTFCRRDDRMLVRIVGANSLEIQWSTKYYANGKDCQAVSDEHPVPTTPKPSAPLNTSHADQTTRQGQKNAAAVWRAACRWTRGAHPTAFCAERLLHGACKAESWRVNLVSNDPQSAVGWSLARNSCSLGERAFRGGGAHARFQRNGRVRVRRFATGKCLDCAALHRGYDRYGGVVGHDGFDRMARFGPARPVGTHSCALRALRGPARARLRPHASELVLAPTCCASKLAPTSGCAR